MLVQLHVWSLYLLQNDSVGWDPVHLWTQMGPLGSAEQRERVTDYIEKGKAEGAELVVGGG